MISAGAHLDEGAHNHLALPNFIPRHTDSEEQGFVVHACPAFHVTLRSFDKSSLFWRLMSSATNREENTGEPRLARLLSFTPRPSRRGHETALRRYRPSPRPHDYDLPPRHARSQRHGRLHRP